MSYFTEALLAESLDSPQYRIKGDPKIVFTNINSCIGVILMADDNLLYAFHICQYDADGNEFEDNARQEILRLLPKDKKWQQIKIIGWFTPWYRGIAEQKIVVHGGARKGEMITIPAQPGNKAFQSLTEDLKKLITPASLTFDKLDQNGDFTVTVKKKAIEVT
jgi:hypothetical protein